MVLIRKYAIGLMKIAYDLSSQSLRYTAFSSGANKPEKRHNKLALQLIFILFKVA